MKIIELNKKDLNYYNYLGPFFGSRDVAKALGGIPYDDINKRWVVAIDKNKCVAISAYIIKKDIAELKSSYVLPEYRGKGIYTALLVKRLNTIKNKKTHKIKCTATGMSKNILEKEGFVCVGNIGKYYKMEYKIK